MRRGWLLFALFTLAPGLAWAAERGVVVIEDKAGNEVAQYRESHALLIGVSGYANGWPPLRGVKGDLQAVKEALERKGFQVEMVEDPDQATLEAAYRDFILRHGRKRNNRLLFYFAGHGYTEKPAYATDDPQDWMGYIVSRDAPLPALDFSGFRRNAMSMQRFEELAKDIQSKHALFVFDSCFSGSVFSMTRAVPKNISGKTAKPVRQFITSGSADQEVPDVSEFRRQFIAALAGAGDLTGDGYVTGSELGLFLEEQVTNYSEGAQTPQYGKLRNRLLDKGDFVFVAGGEPREAAKPVPPPPPVKYLGNVQVNVNVPATVYIGDEKKGQAAPGRPLNQTGVRTGRTEVRVDAAGYQSATQVAEVKRGQWAQLVFELKSSRPPPAAPPQKAQLTVRSNVRGDTVYIDGKARGPTGPEAHELVPGTYRVLVEKPGYDPAEKHITLGPGVDETLWFVLNRQTVGATPSPVQAQRGWLGVRVQAVTQELADAFGMQQPRGALVTDILADSPAEQAGIHVSDIIVELDGGVVDASTLQRLVRSTPVNSRVPLTVLRRGEAVSLMVTIAELPEQTEPAPPSALASSTAQPRPHQTWTEPLTGMEFVWVPPGCFQMGTEEGYKSERPVRRVCVKGYWLGKYEVTQGQWQRVMESKPAHFQRGDYPVEAVSWDDAQTFIRKLNGKGPVGLRLPSEAEWEYACRSGGRAESYCGGEDVDSLAWHGGNSGHWTTYPVHPVGRKQANGLGLHDMSGNVSEWVQDCSHWSYEGAPRDGLAWEAGDCAERVYRGGSWHNSPGDVRSARRSGDKPGRRLADRGFRLARDL